MNFDFLHIAVISLFVIQLLSISGYVSYRWRTSRRQLLLQYPQSRFPNLYVQPEQKELERLSHRKWLDYLSGLFGIFALSAALVFQFDTTALSRAMIIVAGIQIIPIIVSGYWCTKNCNTMKARFPETTRHTTTKQGAQGIQLRLISSLSIFLFVTSMIVCSVLITEIQDPDSIAKFIKIQWLNAAVFVAILSLYLASVYGKKTDNFADPDEYELRRKAKQRYLTLSFCIFQLFILIILFSQAINISSVYIAIITSILVQGIVISTKEQYFPINPHAYK